MICQKRIKYDLKRGEKEKKRGKEEGEENEVAVAEEKNKVK